MARQERDGTTSPGPTTTCAAKGAAVNAALMIVLMRMGDAIVVEPVPQSPKDFGADARIEYYAGEQRHHYRSEGRIDYRAEE